MLTLYKEEDDNLLLGVCGRLHSGIGSMEGLPDGNLVWKLQRLLGMGLTLYESTRSVFAAPKAYKEAVRPACSRDFDLKKSFPNAIVSRHGDLDVVAQWCEDPMACVGRCGMGLTDANLKMLKDFCNSAAGSGEPVVDTFLMASGLQELPQWARLYRDQLRTAAARDYEAHPDWVAVLSQDGRSQREITNKIHYVCNCITERQEVEAARVRVATAPLNPDPVRWTSNESDGLVAIPDRGVGRPAWDTRVLALMGSKFSIKPYREFDELVTVFRNKHPEIHDLLFSTYDDKWVDIEKIKLECARRIRNNEQPSMRYAKCMPFCLMAQGCMVKDIFRPISPSFLLVWFKKKLIIKICNSCLML